MSDTVPFQEPPAPSARQLQRRHTLTLTAIVAVLTLAMLAFGWSVYARQRSTLWWGLSTQGEQLQLALNTSLDVARTHVAAMRQSTERNLRQPALADASLADRVERRNLAPLRDAPWDRLPQDLVKDVGAVHVDPSSGADYRRDLTGPLGALAQVTAAHAQHKGLLWSYFYDAQKQWRWVFPSQSRDEVLTATGKPDMGAALRVLWDAAGTTPLETAGPASNPQKELVWTAPHTEPLKKVSVVSVLAPVYSGNGYVGVVGTDLALSTLSDVLVQHPLQLGHAWVVDGQGRVLASSNPKAQDALPAGPYTADTGWLRFALRGTDWALLVQAPSALISRQALTQMLPFIGLGIVALLALAGSCLWLGQRFTQPALQLADYVQQTDGPNIKRAPPVPLLWKPWFDRVTRQALQRREQMLGVHQRTTQLEAQVAQQVAALHTATAEHEAQLNARSAELRGVYAQLSAALADLQATQSAHKKTGDTP
ncbi:cache domain-containing protein [Rhodoferax saidenbachensis]|uniref:Coiled-coil protein SlyX n=1 Tax=Rhodoferax saidenbachensis TaxID=1484693 RepID=A0ABU1ZSI1_9BURK|nr:cache domain-containing protein [Rhodoferax saidenbachensis]MDR7308358.1 putative coiled-coil protein SlyX [Rhodoferax saidenbachensis]